MKKTLLRAISLVLVLTFVCAVLVSCKDNENENSGGGSYTFIDNLPDDLSFEGQTFTILGREDNTYGYFAHEITADETSVETVDQAVYMRNLHVSERFGCEIKPLLIAGQWNAKDEFIQYFKQSVMSSSGSFDMIVSQQAYMAELGLSEFYMNAYDDEISKYIDLDRDYYYQDIKDEITLNNKLFFIVGDYSLTYLEYLYVLLFNKDIQNDYSIPDLYQMVRDGEWTIDKMIEYTKLVYEDKNGDGGESKEDVFGLVTDYQNTADALYSQFDCQLTSKDDNDNVSFTIDQGKVTSILTKMVEYYALQNVYTIKTSSDLAFDNNDADIIFQESRALFYPERLTKAESFRSMDVGFGIIPYPKWDASQSDYYTQSQNGYSVVVIPVDAPDVTFSAAMIEALTAESNNTVVPAYYDVALKSKYARDDESGEMIDIAKAGARISFGYFFAANLGSSTQIFRENMYQKITAFSSFWAANQGAYNRYLKKVLAEYEDDKE